MERWLTVDDVAEVLQLSRSRAYTYVHRMEHMDAPLRVAERVLTAWIEDHTVYPQIKALKKAAKLPYR